MNGNSKQVLLRVSDDIYYQLTGYAEQERRTVNNAVQYILQRFFEEHPVSYMEDEDGGR